MVIQLCREVHNSRVLFYKVFATFLIDTHPFDSRVQGRAFNTGIKNCGLQLLNDSFLANKNVCSF